LSVRRLVVLASCAWRGSQVTRGEGGQHRGSMLPIIKAQEAIG